MTRFIHPHTFIRLTQRIKPSKWIRPILVEVYTAQQPYRVQLRVAPTRRIIVAEGVVMQPRFAVQILPLEAQVLRHIPADARGFPFAVSPGGGHALPHHVAVAIGDFFRQTIQFGVIPENVSMLPDAVGTGQRFVAVLRVDILHRRIRIAVAVFADHLQTRPREMRAFRLVVALFPHQFFRAATRSILAEFGFDEPR